MKNFFTTIFLISFLILLNENETSASTDLSVDEEYVTKDPITGKYSNDWSHLDTPENFQLQKDVQAAQKNSINTLNSNQITKLHSDEDLQERIFEFLIQIDPEMKSYISQKSFKDSNNVSIMADYVDDKVEAAALKILETKIHLSVGALSPSEVAAAFQNGMGAIDHATKYAQDKNFYLPDGRLKTWENPADTLRHFAWNFMNSNDMGVNKARVVGDIHEVARIAQNYVNTDKAALKVCNYNYSCAQTMGIRSAQDDWNSSKTSLAFFNRTFSNSSVMDLLNNSYGRKAYLQGYTNYSTPFNILLNNFTLIQFPKTINSSLRTSAWNGFK